MLTIFAGVPLASVKGIYLQHERYFFYSRFSMAFLAAYNHANSWQKNCSKERNMVRVLDYALALLGAALWCLIVTAILSMV